MIKYSFIIPHKNTPFLLNRCIDSIPERDDIEIIVIDDNSEKDKKPFISRRDVKFIYLNENNSRGAGRARNIGMERASGTWLLFPDSDDYYCEGFLEILDHQLNEKTEILVFSAFIINSKEDTNLAYNRFDKFIQCYLNSCKQLKDKRRVSMFSNVPWNKVFSKRFIENNNIRFEEISRGNDAWFVVYSGSIASNVDVISQKLYNYELNSSGLTQKPCEYSTYILSLHTGIKTNKLKAKNGLWDLVSIYGVEFSYIKNSYGIEKYIEWLVYKLSHDYTIYPAFFYVVFNTMIRKINTLLKIC